MAKAQSTAQMSVTTKKDSKFEYVYIKNAICYYANVHKARKIYQKAPNAKNPSENEYSITLFFDEKCKDALEDDVKLNKQIFQVGKDKNKRRAIKFPLSSQVEEGKSHYDLVEGLYGLQVTLKELNNKGQKNTLVVLDSEGNALTDNIGNGSRVSVKLFGYRNQEDLLNVALNMVVVNDLVEYEGGSGSGDGTFHDDELGVSFQVPKREEAPVKEEEPPFDPLDF